MKKVYKLAIAIVAVATFANTFAHILVPSGPSWLAGEIITIAFLSIVAACIKILVWALDEPT